MFMFVVHNLNLFVVTLQLPSQFPMRMVFQSSQISIVLSTTHSNEKCEWFSTCSYLQSYHPLFINLPFPSSRRSVFLFSLVFTYFFSLGVPRLGPCLCMCLVVNKFMIFKINSITAELGTPYEPPYLNLLTYLFVIRSALQLLVYLTPIPGLPCATGPIFHPTIEGIGTNLPPSRDTRSFLVFSIPNPILVSAKYKVTPGFKLPQVPFCTQLAVSLLSHFNQTKMSMKKCITF